MHVKKELLVYVVAALAVIAAFGVSQALAAEFHSEVPHTTLKGTSEEEVWTVNAGTIKCSEVHYSGTMSTSTTTTVTLTPVYTGCTAFGFVNTTIDTTGCGFTFHTLANTGNTAGQKTLECEASNPMTVTAFNCWITFGAQGPLTGVTYTNQGAMSLRDVTVDFDTTETIKYTQHSKSFPGCTNGTFTNGSHTGSITIQGFTTEGGQVGFWVH